MSLWRKEVELLHEITFDNESPEACLELLEASSNFIGLKNRIQKADQKWIEELLGHGVLEKLFEALAILSSKTSIGFTDAVQEVECTRCIKSIMNHKYGMEYVIQAEEKFINKLTEGNHISINLLSYP